MDKEQMFNDAFFKQFKTGEELNSFLAQLQKRGIEKIPSSLKLIEENSTYIYNTIKFKVID